MRNPYYTLLKPALGGLLRVSSDSALFSLAVPFGAQERHLKQRSGAGFKQLCGIPVEYFHDTTARRTPCPDRQATCL